MRSVEARRAGPRHGGAGQSPRKAGDLQAGDLKAGDLPDGMLNDPPGGRVGAALEQGAFAGFVLLLAVCPFWFGSNRLVAWGLNAALVGLILLCHEIGLRLQGKPYPLAPSNLIAPAAALAATLLWILAQLLDLGPDPIRLWETGRSILGRPVAGTLSISPDLTGIALVRLLTVAGMFWLAVQFGRSEGRALFLVRAMAAIGTAYAVYGIVGLALSPNTVLWYPREAYRGVAISTFVNRNSFAAYSGIMLLATLALAIALLERLMARETGWRRRLAAALDSLSGGIGFALAAMIIIAMALMLTSSRAGIMSTLIGILCFAALLSIRRSRRKTVGVVIVTAAIALVALVMVSYGDVVAGRVEQTGSDFERRVDVYRIVAASILDNPVIGAGYGTFVDVFPMFRDSTVAVTWAWDKAHNSYLELAQGLGLPGAALYLSMFVLIVGRCLLGAARRQRLAYMPILAVSVSVLLGLHALVDFSMQIQAVALTWACVAGIGYAQAFSTRKVTSHAGSSLVSQARIRMGTS